ncbi:AAA family ATPase [Legionella jordanis]|uniref:Shikimate kinase n=1 Tax=Legionella jordanis TaxID=456 RepID=A0A0W0VB03_9GAMM|nr:AAA family ATPase [Legionella jordanis]KTD17046.1 shikimate kinase [Legionella jordanis]RMX03182.1 AAA family ATPase [Legionella jordanis]RMX18679.1 AAA family ATPase [Legionella jordanis]VEH12757.1 L-seryl-tRNA(Sec) kinase [Legionella jordanis]HAT8713096.1 AAA family ATPase [Legionella jordanis]
MLIIFSGLPGVGKTTISRKLAQALKAVYLRVDTIEQALTSTTNSDFIGPEGYVISYAIAKENLKLGLNVVADCVNPLEITRKAWRKVALEADSTYFEVELICSNIGEHRKRVESRLPDICNHRLPTWQEVVDKDYETWKYPVFVFDTSKLSVDRCVEGILQQISVSSQS